VKHTCNVSDREWAEDYVEQNKRLWSRKSLAFLRKMYHDLELTELLNETQALRRSIKLSQDYEERMELSSQLDELLDRLTSNDFKKGLRERLSC
jgi:hypothetical protein